jgi:hypothetical protein
MADEEMANGEFNVIADKFSDFKSRIQQPPFAIRHSIIRH